MKKNIEMNKNKMICVWENKMLMKQKNKKHEMAMNTVCVYMNKNKRGRKKENDDVNDFYDG